jgi:hypothetical protein
LDLKWLINSACDETIFGQALLTLQPDSELPETQYKKKIQKFSFCHISFELKGFNPSNN